MVPHIRTSAFGLALPSHSLAPTLLASDGIKIKEAFPIFLQERIERQRVQRADRRYDHGLDPSEAILQGRYQPLIGKPPQCSQRDTVFLARLGVDQSLLRSKDG